MFYADTSGGAGMGTGRMLLGFGAVLVVGSISALGTELIGIGGDS
jgi:Flp pilus assembly pilin Flp